ncbi:MAG: LptF/LptG family permease [Candidatus Aerophobetes bacterium]|nr:LptF/LptG family permease [Candidatus Aerophobetes bacterium]
MKIIHRYILKEIIASFILGFLFFNFILFITVIFELTELIFIQDAPLLEVGKLILFKMPSFFSIVIPVSLLFATLLSFGRLSGDGEITALQSSGISLLYISKSLFIFTLILTLASLYFSAYLTPLCNRHYRKVYQKIVFLQPTIQIKERIIVDIGDRKLYAYHIKPGTNEMRKVIIYEFFPKGNKIPQISLAQEGKFSEETLKLKEVSFYRFQKNYQIAQQGKFDSQIIYLGKYLSQKEKMRKKTEEMDLKELREKIEEERLKENPDKRRIRALSIDFHSRMAIPLAAFFLILIGIPLGIKVERGEKSISFGISLAIVIVYYLLFLAGEFLGKGGIIPPLIAMWLPNILLCILGILLNFGFDKMRRI